MDLELRKLTANDDMDIYVMLQEIPKDENGFINPINGRTFEEFRLWLMRSEAAAKSKELKDNWKVPASTFWLYAEGNPVGFGKLRHFLTDKLKEEGGHAGYSIRPSQRNKGYGTALLKMLTQEAKKISIDRILLTIRNSNAESIKVALNSNGKIEKVNEERHFIWIECR